MAGGNLCEFKKALKRRCHFPFAVRTVDSPVQKKYRSLERGAVSNASTTVPVKRNRRPRRFLGVEKQLAR